MFTGAGQLQLITTTQLDAGGASEIFFNDCIASFTLKPEEQKIEAVALTNNIQQVIASAITKRSFTLELVYEYTDWLIIQLAYNEVAHTGAAALPIVMTGTISGNADNSKGQILDANISSQHAAFTSAVVQERNTATPLVAGTDYTVSAGKIEFAPSLIGQSVTYTALKSYNSVASIGATDNPTLVGDLAFTGIIASTASKSGYLIHIPKLQRSKTPELKIDGNKPSLVLEYTALLQPLRNLPFQMFDLDSAE